MMNTHAERAMTDPSRCPHTRTQLIAKDEESEYVECLDCGAILELSERRENGPGFDESLSDA
jgi:transcription initiation factor TFIIIB Brf1 subunit/transcription initiation factor TFIIB